MSKNQHWLSLSPLIDKAIYHNINQRKPRSFFHTCVAINTVRPRPNRRHFADDIFKCIFENENEWISHRISLKFVPKVRINNIPALVQIMAWRRPGDKPLSKPMMLSLLTHICVTRPQWVKNLNLPNVKFVVNGHIAGYYYNNQQCRPWQAIGFMTTLVFSDQAKQN